MTPYVYFDLDDTLLDHGSASQVGAGSLFERYPVLEKLGRNYFLSRWPELTERHMDRYFAGEVDFAAQRRARMRELFSWVSVEVDDADADAAFEVYVSAYFAAIRAFDDVAPCLDALDRAGVAAGVLTNGRVSAQTRKLEALGLGGRFRSVLVTEEIGVHKPNPKVFVEAARRAGRPVGECVYVGDKRETDACAAVAAGMHGIWLDRHGTAALEETLRITDLGALPAVLGI